MGFQPEDTNKNEQIYFEDALEKATENNNFSSNESISYEEALEKAGQGRFQFFIVIIGGIIILSSYVSVGSIAYILPAAQCDLHMDSQAKGRLASVGFLGLIISCHLWGFLSDTLGRRYILIRCLLIDGLLYFVTSLTPYFSVILVFRLVNGFVSSGGVACIYAYVGEFLTDKNRTKGLMAASMVASFAFFIVPFYAWLTLPGKWSFPIYPGLTYKSWRLYYAICGLPSLICVLLIYFLPESPKFVLSKGNTTESIKILRTIHKFNGKHKDKDYSVKDIKINENEKVAKFDDNKNKVLAFLKLMWNQTAPLFSREHRLNITLVCLAQYFTYFSNGGMYLWLPETMNRLAVYRSETKSEYASFCDIVEYGKNSDFLNATTDITRINSDNLTTTFAPHLMIINKVCSEDVDVTVYFYLGMLGVAQTINLAFITTLSRVCNKKYLLMILSACALSASVALRFMKMTDFAVYNSCLLIVFTGAIIPIINSVVVELFPTNLRGMAACLTLMGCRVGTVTTNIIAGSMIDKHCNEFVCCFIFTMALCFITVSLMPKNTSSDREMKSSETKSSPA